MLLYFCFKSMCVWGFPSLSLCYSENVSKFKSKENLFFTFAWILVLNISRGNLNPTEYVTSLSVIFSLGLIRKPNLVRESRRQQWRGRSLHSIDVRNVCVVSAYYYEFQIFSWPRLLWNEGRGYFSLSIKNLICVFRQQATSPPVNVWAAKSPPQIKWRISAPKKDAGVVFIVVTFV